MDRQVELGIVRAAYAKQVLAAARVHDERLEAAFSAIRREDFLGSGPWPIFRQFRDYVLTPDPDPVYLYTDAPVGILPEKRINNRHRTLTSFTMRRQQRVSASCISELVLATTPPFLLTSQGRRVGSLA